MKFLSKQPRQQTPSFISLHCLDGQRRGAQYAFLATANVLEWSTDTIADQQYDVARSFRDIGQGHAFCDCCDASRSYEGFEEEIRGLILPFCFLGFIFRLFALLYPIICIIIPHAFLFVLAFIPIRVLSIYSFLFVLGSSQCKCWKIYSFTFKHIQVILHKIPLPTTGRNEGVQR
jgi:hypothetical protein